MTTKQRDTTLTYTTKGGIAVTRVELARNYDNAIGPLQAELDEHRGVLLTSSFEYPGRYTRWDLGFTKPPIAFSARGLSFAVEALNGRGETLLAPIGAALAELDFLSDLKQNNTRVCGTVVPSAEPFPEELRSKQPSVFSVLRRLIELFAYPKEEYLGFYGAFGYELAFQFEPVRQRLERASDARDLVLYLPDDLTVVDHRRQSAIQYRYDFTCPASFSARTTQGMERTSVATPYIPSQDVEDGCDHEAGEYAACVRKAIDAFACGDLFEVVPGQTFFRASKAAPSEIFAILKKNNPAPYGALINLGNAEYLVAASPEMYVRVDGRRIETCPISGTIQRGENAIGDAAQILKLLSSEKETSELTMCTDVDRNDKSRVCEPGSVRVIGRRQLELYSKLIHTVDHVEGRLREGYDALDGFLAHTWAVTVTGAPKQHAIQFIEDNEKSPRCWYGGALGFVGFSGNMNTGLTLRTVRIKDGVAQVRAGATLLFESDPESEEKETRLKASALLDAISQAGNDNAAPRIVSDASLGSGKGKKVLVVDHEDSFVHTLAGYLRETGANVITYRAGFSAEQLDREQPDLVLLSPGPGRPQDFATKSTIDLALARDLPIFGVCLGLQGIVEYYGGTLCVLATPMHGKPSLVNVMGGRLFEGLPTQFEAGRYHSLYADKDALPSQLNVTATSDDGVIMAVEHATLPVAAVQFHPESILTLNANYGRRLIENVMRVLV